MTTFAFSMRMTTSPLGRLWWRRRKEPTCKAGETGDVGSIPQLGRPPRRRRKWQPTPAFSPGESHGQRSLVGCSPRGCQGCDMTSQLNNKNKQSPSGQHVVLGLRAWGWSWIRSRRSLWVVCGSQKPFLGSVLGELSFRGVS